MGSCRVDVESLLRDALENGDCSGLRDALKDMDKRKCEACMLRAVLWKDKDEETAEVVRMLLEHPKHKLTAHQGSTNLLLEAVRHNKHKTIPYLVNEGCGTLLNVHESGVGDFMKVIVNSSVATKQALKRAQDQGRIVIDLSRYPVMHMQAHTAFTRLQMAALMDLGASVHTVDENQRKLEDVLTVLGQLETAQRWPEMWST